jgi:hypothetical protein
MEICPKCQSLLRIGNSYITVTGDETPDIPTEVFTNLPMLCVNPSCDDYCGKNTSDPLHVVEVIQSKIY